MSTCPRCRQYLGENHRCSRWIRWRRNAWRIAFIIAGAAAGGILGSVIGPPFDLILIPVGALAGYRVAPRRRRPGS